MRHRTFFAASLLGLALVGARAAADSALPPGPQSVSSAARNERESLRAQLVQKMRPDVRPRIASTARVLVFDLAVQQHKERTAPRTGPRPPPLDVVAAARAHIADAQNYGVVNAQAVDIDGLVQIVLLEAAHDADSDLRAALAAMRAAHRAKAKERDLVDKLRHEQELRKEDFERIAAVLKDKADDARALADLAEEMSTRLQLAQERQTKLASLLSSVLKQKADSAQSVIDKMK